VFSDFGIKVLCTQAEEQAAVLVLYTIIAVYAREKSKNSLFLLENDYFFVE
jgi:hypothetical protein